MRKITLRRVLSIPLGIPILALALVLFPWRTLRIGRLRSERIGHYLMNTEMSLCELEQRPPKVQARLLDLYFDVPPVCNAQVQDMWRRTLRLGPRPLLQPAYLLFKALGMHRHIIEPPSEDRDVLDCLTHQGPHMSFSTSETLMGRRLVADLLGTEMASWVCLHQRDSAYLASTLKGEDWDYHSYRDSPISDYMLAAEELADRGFFVLRMGKIVSEPMITSHPRIIDYASSEVRSDFLDVYLAAHCSFFLSTGSGIDSLATVFRRPQLLVNFPLPLHPLTSRPDHLFIYQHFEDAHSGAPLSIRELHRRGAERFFSSRSFAAADVYLRRNSPEEIRAAAVEMAERINGSWRENAEEAAQQISFWSAFPRERAIHGEVPFRARIGSQYLKDNMHLTGP